MMSIGSLRILNIFVQDSKKGGAGMKLQREIVILAELFLELVLSSSESYFP